jgi:Reverse transcriptase (RNA-dependent DNA polymerase)
MNDIIRAIDGGEVTALVLLDLSAAFDTVDHSTLLDILHRRFAVERISLLWFNSYLSNQSQSFFFDGVQSKSIIVDCSVPQGSILGPLEFIYYTEDVVDIFERNLVRHHLFADDKQLYRSGKISEIDNIRNQLCRCVTDVRDWCSSRRLQLNALKTELQWCGSHANLSKLSSADLTHTVGNGVIQPVTIVRDLGVYLDAELTMKQHISRVVSICFFQLRRLRQIRRSVGEEVNKRLVTALVLNRLDYCNASLAGLPESTIRPLQRVQNAAARLITNTNPREHISAVLMRLHWLPIKSRIKFKLCLQMHLIHTNQRPDYMAEIVQLTAARSSRPVLRSASHILQQTPR